MLHSKSQVGLKAVVREKIMKEVIQSNYIKTINKRTYWRVLVVDRLGMRMISACCKMNDIYDEGITLVEDLLSLREPIVKLEAIYLISPCETSINALITDFPKKKRRKEKHKYKAAHIYFTDPCSDLLFDKLCTSIAAKKIKTLKEINVAFIPFERQVFSLDSNLMFDHFFNPLWKNSRQFKMKRIAQQIATVCVSLGEYPSVRYRKDCECTFELARIVQQKLNVYKMEDSKIGEGFEKSRSQLIILDRGFDCVSPILHELSFQAMAYDNLSIVNDVYKFYDSDGIFHKEVLLDENDELWMELRHQYITDVTKYLTDNLKKFVDPVSLLAISEGKYSLRTLSNAIKKMPQHRKELSHYSTHLSIAENCLKCLSDNMEELCKLEQELAMNQEGGKIKEKILKSIMVILSNQNISNDNKMRIIILYILSKNGVPEENLNKLVQLAQLSESDKQAIVNLNLLGINTILNGTRKKQHKIPRKKRSDENECQFARWTPVVKDLIENCITDELDSEHFPFISVRAAPTGHQAPTSVRYRAFLNNKTQQPKKNVSRIIVFIIGGVTFSEIRSAYEITENLTNWEVIIGSSNILTPNGFLNNLTALNKVKSNKM